jgi:hypothetical protein
MRSLVAVSGIRRRKQAAPQCRARRRMGRASAPPPWKAHGQSASMVFRSCPSCRRRKFGSVIVFAAWLAQVRQEAGPSLRSERDLSALSLRLVRLTWAVLRILAFSRDLTGECRMVLRLTVINVGQGREAGA